MKFHKRAAPTSIFCALPFVFTASWLWISAQKLSFYSDTAYNLGDAIFHLGFPLTTGFFNLLLNQLGGKFTQESEFWALPLMNISFLIQWILWSQLIVLIYRQFKKLK